jgi:hypothetical protein
LSKSPTATCYQPDRGADECCINWYSLAVSADSSDYIINMWAILNDAGAVALYQGFFQISAYVPYDMQPEAFRVDCGKLGSGGDPTRGMAHTYYIEAFDSTGKLASNFGAVLCPASVLLFRDGFESGSLSLWSSHTPLIPETFGRTRVFAEPGLLETRACDCLTPDAVAAKLSSWQIT